VRLSGLVHEWALAEAIVRYLKQEASLRGAAPKRVVVGLGELQAVDREVFEFALRELMKMEGLESIDIELREIPAKLRCRRCGFEWSLREVSIEEWVREAIHFVPEAAHSYLSCPRCGSHDFEIVSGRGVEICSVEY